MMMKKAICALFIAVIFGVAVVALILPDRGFSALERRDLQQAPRFSFRTVIDGTFESEAEKYIADQFPLRDELMSLKAAGERLTGKKEFSGVYLCGDTLIERLDDVSAERAMTNLRAVNRFAEEAGVPVYLTVLPTAEEIWREKLPDGAPRCDEAALIGEIQAQCRAIWIDTLTPLREHADEAVFYRTDHHWTSLGASFGAEALLGALGLAYKAVGGPTAVSTQFYGTLYAKSGVRNIAPDRIDIYAADDGVTVTRIENGEEQAGAMYDWDKLTGDDQYAFFMGGNVPLSVIRTGHDGPKLLLVRDSYADCEAPFLTGAFSEIHMIDLRYFHSGVKAYIAENGIDMAVISYSIRSFGTDTNVFFLNAAG